MKYYHVILTHYEVNTNPENFTFVTLNLHLCYNVHVQVFSH